MTRQCDTRPTTEGTAGPIGALVNGPDRGLATGRTGEFALDLRRRLGAGKRRATRPTLRVGDRGGTPIGEPPNGARTAGRTHERSPVVGRRGDGKGRPAVEAFRVVPWYHIPSSVATPLVRPAAGNDGQVYASARSIRYQCARGRSGCWPRTTALSSSGWPRGLARSPLGCSRIDCRFLAEQPEHGRGQVPLRERRRSRNQVSPEVDDRQRSRQDARAECRRKDGDGGGKRRGGEDVHAGTGQTAVLPGVFRSAKPGQQVGHRGHRLWESVSGLINVDDPTPPEEIETGSNRARITTVT